VESGGVVFACDWTRASANDLVLFHGGVGRRILI
jgi:hypothetical protein